MSEDQIERMVEHKMDRLDKAYMRGNISEDDYNRKIAEIDAEAERLYRMLG